MTVANGGWRWQCEITEDNNKDALRKAPANLKPEHDDKPIRIEPDNQPLYRDLTL